MELFDLIGQLRTYAATQGWGFAAGDNFYQNIEVANQTLTAGQLVLTAEFNTSPSIVNGRVVQVTYSGSIMLGRKQDFDGQQSTLDETYMQKYDRRLLELMTLLANAIGDFTCTNELEITAIEFIHSINTFNTNIDFVGGNITIVQ